ncbi:MAG: hypothetical protein ACLUTA_06360 [Blautia wexlerae]
MSTCSRQPENLCQRRDSPGTGCPHIKRCGRNATQIKQVLEEQKLDSSIYITLKP